MMRRPRLLRNASPQSLCVFCASRFLEPGLIPSPLISRRRLNTTRAPHQSAAAAVARQPNGNGSDGGQSSSRAPESFLTAAELKEKEHRRRQRELAEQERRRQESESFQARQSEEQRQRPFRARPTAGRQDDRSQTFRIRKFDAGGRGYQDEGSRSNQSSRNTNVRSESPFSGRLQRDGSGLSGEAAASRLKSQEWHRSAESKRHKVAMPSFGSDNSASSFAAGSSGGWGSGSSETKPLEYAEEDDDLAKRAEYQSQESRQQTGISQDLEPSSPDRDIQNLFRSSVSRQGSQHQLRQPSERPYYNEYGSTGYRTSPFNPDKDYRSTAYDTTPQADWSHLRKRGSSSEPSPPPPSQQPPQRQSSYQPSQDEIDRGFLAHLAERPQRRPQNFRRTTVGREVPDDPFATETETSMNRKCARCLQVGHTAKECTAPPAQVKCHYCGQTGHMKHECPNKQRKRAAQDGYDSVFGEQQDTTPFRKGQGQETSKADTPTTFTSFQPQTQWSVPTRETSQPKQQPEHSDLQRPSDVGEGVDRRASSRSARGFEDDEDSPQPQPQFRERRKSRRNMEREDDEARDEANALREERMARKAARKASRKRADEQAERQATPLTLPEFISVSQLAQVLNVRYERLLERLEQEGYDDVFPSKILNMETSGMIAMEYNFEPQFEYESAVAREEQERDLKPRPEVDDKSLLPTRPPVVTIMGHVDHGKTTILDYLRKSSVAAGEAGGITQHIGAFSVPMSSSGRTITFLDTPGHAAFLAMRQRGANVTDIVVLVVAADDSVKPQTLESLRCAREAGVPILVAINKVDKDGADVQRVKQDLAKNGVEIEDFGGDVQTVEISGKTGQGIDGFEEAIVTLSEILDHRAETDGEVEGWVLEATTKSNGRVATILVKRGTLRVGQVLVAGKTWARVRTLKNEKGQNLKEVGPGMPIEVDGWREQATAGDQVLQAPSEQKAASVVEYREEIAEREKLSEDMEAINEARRLEQEKRAKEKAAEEAAKRADSDELARDTQPQQDNSTSTGQMSVPFIIKADVSGSAEAVSAYIPSLTSPLIAPQILSFGVGAVNESDIEYAATANGHIIAFNLPQNNEAMGLAQSRGVKILENDVIYRTLDQVKEVLEEKLPPLVTQRVLGEAEVALGFDIGLGGRKKMRIAGCKIRNGVVGLKARARVMRGGVNGQKVYDGTVSSLKNVKKDVQEMRKGTECGMAFEDWEGFEVGDVVQTYEEVSEKRRL